MAAGSAGASLFTEKLRPWLVWISVACLVLAFVQTYFRARCDFRTRRFRTVLLWFSTVVVVAMVLAPHFTATILAGRRPHFFSSGELRTFEEMDFRRAFDAAAGQTRIVLLLSPT